MVNSCDVKTTSFQNMACSFSHLDDGVADAPGLFAEHRVFEGLVHNYVGNLLQIYTAGVCRRSVTLSVLPQNKHTVASFCMFKIVQ